MPRTASKATIAEMAEAFNRIRRLTIELATTIEQDLGMTLPQVQALEVISDGARQVSDVARMMIAHVSTASRVVDQLVTADLVDRQPDPDDRRAVTLQLTDAGRRRLGELEDVRVRLLSDVVGDFDEDERAEFTRLLCRFADGIERNLGESPDAATT